MCERRSKTEAGIREDYLLLKITLVTLWQVSIEKSKLVYNKNDFWI